jgi:hypothetical protein
MGMPKQGPSKAELRAEQDRLMEEFFARGGQVTKVPPHSHQYGDMRFRQSALQAEQKKVVPQRNFDPHKESEELGRKARERSKLLEAYQVARRRGEEVQKPSIPWEE